MSTQESFVLSADLAHNSCALPRMDMTPSKSPQERLPHVEPFHAGVHAGGFIIAECPQNGVDYGLISGTCTSSASIARPSRQSS